MSDRYPGGLITKTPVTPSGPTGTNTAPGVWTLEQQAYWQAQGSWPSPYGTQDPYFEYVTLLLNNNNTNGGQNNTFLDSSTNNFSITRNGNTTQGTFTPFSQTGWWSNRFGDSSSDKLSVPASTNWDFGSGDFTLEAWLFPTADMTDSHIFSLYNSGGTGFWDLRLTTTNKVRFYWNNASNNITSSGTVTKYIWNHIVCVRSGSTISIFINGTRDGTGSITSINNNSGADPLYLGSQYTFDRRVYGYLSNGRIVKGTAVYDATASTLTVPTSPLTAISGTQLLTFQANRFKDSSANNYTVTAAGSVQVQRFSPFNLTTPYSTTTIGGSGYFDGSSYLTVADNTALQMGSGDFTIEFYWYPTSFTSYQTPLDKGYINAGGILLQTDTGTGTLKIFASGSNVITASSSAILNAWNHVALVRSGTSLVLYLNGVSVGSATNSTNFNNTTQVGIGANGGSGGGTSVGQYPIYGYMSSVRMVKGTAVYTTTFTPPTAPLTAITNTSLLCNFTNAALYDSAMANDIETGDTAQVSTDVQKFSLATLKTTGATSGAQVQPSSLRLPSSANWSFGTGDFTIEGWCYATSGLAVDSAILCSELPSRNWLIQWQNGDYFRMQSAYAGAINLSSSGSTTFNTWYHFAMVRVSGTLYFYVNGTQTYSGAFAYDMNVVSGLQVGSHKSTSSDEVYMSQVRITKGYARYTSSFTPSTTTFPIW